eukprot:TRINITY_DN91437_c0_g1_i1.p1 TRINITY_DN91437_c0_g1~~TRINITY_DN91437_c0_g1_i1.p1  ORF type:complete len:432 (-),score=111.58 TRINITY_DN91437_c0_g1_i1:212-1507(-)
MLGYAFVGPSAAVADLPSSLGGSVVAQPLRSAPLSSLAAEAASPAGLRSGTGSGCSVLLGVAAAAAVVSSSSSGRRQAKAGASRVSCCAAAAAAAATSPDGFQVEALAQLEEIPVINEHGFVLPTIPDDTQASAFLILDSRSKPQYIGFSKDLRNTLRTLLCRRPELCYSYKSICLADADNKKLLAIRSAWTEELGGLPAGNGEPRQKALWEAPVDSGALNARAHLKMAEQKAKQIARQLRDRDLKELIEFKEELFAEGKVDALPSTLNVEDVLKLEQAVSSLTSKCDYEVMGKNIKFEVLYQHIFDAGSGWWFDVEVSHNKSKSTHRVIVGKDFAASLDSLSEPKKVVEGCFAILLKNRVARKTEGVITSEVFPINYFTAANVAVTYPELLGLFGQQAGELYADSVLWNFKQVHDYSMDERRTIPAGPAY